MRRCDGVVLCDYWEESEGACTEKEEAKTLGMKIWNEEDIGGLPFRSWLVSRDLKRGVVDAMRRFEQNQK